MSAYMIIRAKLSDPQKFGAYSAAMPAAVSAAGGEYLVLGGGPEWLEGESDGSTVVVSRWPSRETAQQFWHSPEYAEIKPLRAGCGEFEVVLVDGLEGSG